MIPSEAYVLKEIAKILVSNLTSGETPLITYGDLAKKLPFDMNPRNLDKYLGTLSDLCKEHSMPLISTIVVNQDTFLPGNGYFKYYYPGAHSEQWEKLFMDNYNAVIDRSDWDTLLDLLDK